ncbi:hypothetical protein BC943DRAFT_360375 [Umbelopsis sp. AD052]|nr:hypothetical protein BC943DRAFT_360375 [Umbelopsis sp. AD052]
MVSKYFAQLQSYQYMHIELSSEFRTFLCNLSKNSTTHKQNKSHVINLDTLSKYLNQVQYKITYAFDCLWCLGKAQLTKSRHTHQRLVYIQYNIQEVFRSSSFQSTKDTSENLHCLRATHEETVQQTSTKRCILILIHSPSISFQVQHKNIHTLDCFWCPENVNITQQQMYPLYRNQEVHNQIHSSHQKAFLTILDALGKHVKQNSKPIFKGSDLIYHRQGVL